MQVGQRNKNWLNVRYNANNNWLGQVGSDNNGYAQFEHPLYGLRAADKVLLNYKLRHNLDTVEDVINRFAPPSDDNPTENYINFVSNRTGYNSQAKIDLEDPTVRENLIEAMLAFETPDALDDYSSGFMQQARGLDPDSSKPRTVDPDTAFQLFTQKEEDKKPFSGGQVGDLTDNNVLGAYDETKYGDLAGQPLEAGTPAGLENDPYTFFTRGIRTGAANAAANINYFRALGNQLLGDEDARDNALAEAEQTELEGSAYMAGLENFEEFLNEPTFGGFINQAIGATGQFLPSAAASIASAIAGAAVGSLVAPGPGTLTGAATGLTGSAMTKALVQKIGAKEAERIVRKKIAYEQAKKQNKKNLPPALDADEEDFLRGAYQVVRGKYAKRGALVGAAGQEYPQGAGIAYGNFADQDMLDSDRAFQALALGVPFTAIGVGGEALVARSFIKQMQKGNGPVHNRILKSIGASTIRTAGTEGVTEGLQEELSIQQKFAIDDSYTQAQANLDRAQAVFAGFFGGAGIGGAGGTVTSIIGKARSDIDDVHTQEAARDWEKERVGQTEAGRVYKEPEEWLGSQYEAMLNPDNKKDSMYIDRDSFDTWNSWVRKNASKLRDKGVFYTTAGGRRIVDPKTGEVVTSEMGLFITTNERKANSFKMRMEKNPYNTTVLDSELVNALGYAHNRKPEDNMVVEVHDDQGNPVWYQSTNSQDLDATVTQANALFAGSSYTVQPAKEVETHLRERKAKLPQEEPDTRNLEFDDEGEVIEDDVDTDETGFERESQIAGVAERAEQLDVPEISDDPPILDRTKQGWAPGRGRDETLKTTARTLFPVQAAYNGPMEADLAAGFYSDSLLNAYVKVAQANPNNLYIIQENNNERYEIRRLQTPDSTADVALDLPAQVTRALSIEKSRIRNENKKTGWKIKGPNMTAPRPVYMPALVSAGIGYNAQLGLSQTAGTRGSKDAGLDGLNTVYLLLRDLGYELSIDPTVQNPVTYGNLTLSETQKAPFRGTTETDVNSLIQQIEDTGQFTLEEIQQELINRRREKGEAETSIETVEEFINEDVNPNTDPRNRIVTPSMRAEGQFEFEPTTGGVPTAQTEVQEPLIYVDENEPLLLRTETVTDVEGNRSEVPIFLRAGDPNAVVLTDELRAAGFEPGDEVSPSFGPRGVNRRVIVERIQETQQGLSPEQEATAAYNAATFYELGQPTRNYSTRPQAPKMTYTVSETLSNRFGAPGFVESLMNIARDKFKLTNEIAVLSADENPNTGNPEIDQLVRDQQQIMQEQDLKGRIINFRNASIILVNLNEGATKFEQGVAALALAHELGHAVFNQEAINSLSNKTLFNNLLKEFEKAKQEIGTNQYEGEFGFEEWYADQIAAYLLDPTKSAKNQAQSFFKRIAAKIQEAFNSLSSVVRQRFDLNPTFAEYVEEVTSSYRDGVKDPIRQPTSLPERYYVRNIVDNFIPQTVKNVAGKKFFNDLRKTTAELLSSDKKIPRMLKYVFYDNDNFLRSLGPVGKQISEIFYAPTQSRTQTGFLTSKIVKINAKVNELSNILGLDEVATVTPEARQILLEAEDNTKANEELSEKAREVREWLSNFYEQEGLNELGIQKLENYYPRLVNIAEIQNSPALRDGLVNLITEFNPSINEQQATEMVDNLVVDPDNGLLEGNETNVTEAEFNDFNLGILKQRAEAFKNIPTARLRQLKDGDKEALTSPDIAIRRYIGNAVKRVEYQKKGGAKEVERLISQLPEEQQEYARNAVYALLGRVNPNMSAPFKFINSWGLVANITTLLAFSVFASLPDLAGPVLRSKEFKGWRNFGREFANYVRNPEEAARLAKDIGVISTEAINTMYINAGELDFMSEKAKRFSEGFFRVTMLEWYTRFTRIMASGMGKRFLQEHRLMSENGDQRSTRYLQELDLTWEDVSNWEKDGQNLENHPKVKLALARFVDESIVRPNAAERPVWASDPRFALIWQLKSFFYAYGKNVIGGVMRESGNRFNEAGLTAAGMPLFLAATALLPLSMLGLDLRERFKVGLAWALPGISPDDKQYRRSLDMDWGEYSFEIIDRSGALGPYALAAPLFMADKRYGDPFWVSPLGPAFEKGFDLATGDFKVKDIIPIYSQL